MPSTRDEPEFLPQGAFPQPDGSVLWRVWAPAAQEVHLVTWPDGRGRTVDVMQPEPFSYFTHQQANVPEGLRYAYQLGADKPELPDPATRWQPDGVHKPSAVLDPSRFSWSDQGWRGIPQSDLIIYELHVGTFTEPGTFEAIIPRLPQLKELGINTLEIMPVSQFPGERNWGYDGVHPYAAQNTYGGPHGLQRLVDACHREGLAVLLDVVYNHMGPEGNYLGEFGPYFTDRYHTPWGDALNYDGPDSEPVRRFMIDNACMWIRDFHMDGLRLDAVQTIYDLGARHFLAELQHAVQQTGDQQQRLVHVIAESDQNDVRLTDPPEQGGYNLDAVWSDDFHHSVHTILSGELDGYFADFGEPRHLVKAFNDVFVRDGSYSTFQRRRVGTRVGDRDRSSFVICLKNHDQIGNRALGDRPSQYLTPAQQRLACGLLLLSPCVPLIFMGEEYGEDRPFPFFCSFGDDRLIEAVRNGRRREFEELNFSWGTEIPDPHGVETFHSAKLTWDWSEAPHGHLRELYRTLLRARKTWPALIDRTHTKAEAVPANATSAEGTLMVIRRGDRPELVACANLGSEQCELPANLVEWNDFILSTEDVAFGGDRPTEGDRSVVLPYELLIFGSQGETT